ncbi:ERAD-associated protein [Aspergillus niger]|uniref:ERAD-associated protein n=1 Tax=Aspergillus niger TaxID=5061 RepID=A0A9W6E719_ASPNG|nr:ERAD-associated protein [Aspergillus niger]
MTPNQTPTPNPKRRRLNTTISSPSSTLTKPFKSPLRRPAPATDTTTTNTPSSISKDSHPQPQPPFHPSPSTPKPSPKDPPKGTPKIEDPTLQSLQTTHRHLQSQLLSLRTELESLTQASRIEESHRDEELEKLIVKWRGVGQRVAEEVFEGARERVSRMGGVRGWREREMERSRSGGWWDDNEGKNGGGEGVKGDEEKEVEAEEEEEEFTIGMMLKTMGIDFKVIGYDGEGQRWV